MKMTEWLKGEWKKAQPPASGPSNTTRILDEDDRIGWEAAQDARLAAPRKPETIKDIQALLRNRNPIKFAQARSGLRWVEKEMKHMGLNPEDARFML